MQDLPAFLCLSLLCVVADAIASEPQTYTEEFDEQLSLNWSIVREDKTRYSLTSHPGEIALTTQAGSMYSTNEQSVPAPKNIFLVKDAIADDEDFDATLQVNVFEPNGRYQQISVLLYQNEQHYFKWEISCRGSADDPQTSMTTVAETGNQATTGNARATPVDGPFWLRMSRRGPDYIALYSNDGDEFETCSTHQWTPDPNAKRPRIGFVAKNGNGSTAETTVIVESFQLTRWPTEDE